MKKQTDKVKPRLSKKLNAWYISGIVATIITSLCIYLPNVYIPASEPCATIYAAVCLLSAALGIVYLFVWSLASICMI